MKRFIAVLAGLLTLPAFADNIPMRSEEGVRSDVISRDIDASVSATAAGRTARRSVVSANRSGASRVVPSVSSVSARDVNSGAGRVVASTRSAVSAAAVGAHKTVARNADAAAVISRNVTPGTRGFVDTSRVAVSPVSRVRSRIATVSSSISKTDKGVSGSDATAAPAANAATAASVTSAMENIASLTAFCKAQYTECMDNFCNVLDDNQGRCSCSKNIKNYEKTENALKSATEALQDVAQQIQYIGLTKTEIDTLFSQTAAELQMQSKTDNSQLKNDLDKIKGLIVEVKSGTASSSEIDSSLSFDLSGMLDFNISSAGFDLASLFGSQSANTNSISNQRGEQLYKTAAARCKTAILNECQSQGVDISIVSNAYDMEIDKQCVAYERALIDANDEMVQTVRNAKSVLQRARLMVAQQKNTYDLRGCVNALDSCMQDDFVCGNEYESCLDPSGKYIVDGTVVLGSMPGQIVENNYNNMQSAMYSTDGLYSTWNYSSNKNAWGASKDGKITEGSLSEYIEKTMKLPTTMGQTVSEFLQYKIGYITGDKANGMCSYVLKRCQDYTYEKDAYKPNNRVVEEYLSRTLVKIKQGQDRVISEYAETCIADVQSCLSENDYDEASPKSSKSNVAVNACRSQIITCMSVNGRADSTPTPAGMADWVSVVMKTSDTTSGTSSGTTSGTSGTATTCPAGTTYYGSGCAINGVGSMSECNSIPTTYWDSSTGLCYCSGDATYDLGSTGCIGSK